jgi:23S rRNA (cytosine1962-C5)-methyltransferase
LTKPDAENKKRGPKPPPVFRPPKSGRLPSVLLKPGEDRRVRRGHLWIFSNEVAQAPEGLAPGEPVFFHTAHGDFLGTGYYHPRSLIAGRVVDREDAVLDTAFFERRLRGALELRQTFFRDDAYRWVHGEADDLPGLVIDRFGQTVVVESYAAGMDRLLEPLIEAVKAVHPWEAVIVKNDAALRKLEGLEDRVETVAGTVSRPHFFEVDGVIAAADLLEGQKTGYFFDQRLNRQAVAALAKGKRVLDVFCHTGGFGLAAAKAGAASVLSIDTSEPALSLGRAAAERSGLAEKTEFKKADAFDVLSAEKDAFDIVVVDPPKFAPSKKQLPQAEEAYIRLNALALRRVAGGGFLATASCSQHVERDHFRQILSRAAQQAGRRARIVSFTGAGPDHPVRPSMPETEYLKFALVHVT